MEWNPITVELDLSDEAMTFDAFTTGETWNGWAVPYFTQSEGKRLAAWLESLKAQDPDRELEMIEWDEARGVFLMRDEQYPDEPETIEGIVNEQTGEILYGIGARKWTWEAAEITV